MSRFVYASEVSYSLDFMEKGKGRPFSCHYGFLSVFSGVCSILLTFVCVGGGCCLSAHLMCVICLR